MKSRVTKWGNSLAVRIPKPVAAAAEFRKGDRLELVVSRPGKIELHAARRKPSLKQLVRRITSENRHGETDWGPPRGGELW